jgi:phosphomannomutase
MTYGNGGGVTDQQVEEALSVIDRLSRLSVPDGCRTVPACCEECKLTFYEELEEARRKVLARDRFLCLACDPDADGPEFLMLYGPGLAEG